MDWITKMILKISPRWGMKRLAKKIGVDTNLSAKGHEFFLNADRVDLIPSKAGYRGFALLVDGESAFYFHQEGDKFVYDGYEMGQFQKGDVTIFDELR